MFSLLCLFIDLVVRGRDIGSDCVSSWSLLSLYFLAFMIEFSLSMLRFRPVYFVCHLPIHSHQKYLYFTVAAAISVQYAQNKRSRFENLCFKSLHAGYFCTILSSADVSFKIIFSSEKSFWNTIRVSNSLDPEYVQTVAKVMSRRY